MAFLINSFPFDGLLSNRCFYEVVTGNGDRIFEVSANYLVVVVNIIFHVNTYRVERIDRAERVKQIS